MSVFFFTVSSRSAVAGGFAVGSAGGSQPPALLPNEPPEPIRLASI
jgi:hypothetical protein